MDTLCAFEPDGWAMPGGPHSDSISLSPSVPECAELLHIHHFARAKLAR